MHVKAGSWPYLPNHGGRWKKRLYEIFSDEEYLRLLNETLILRVRKDSGSLRRGKRNKPPKRDKSKAQGRGIVADALAFPRYIEKPGFVLQPY